ncbi:MAG: biopolymer transporter ExbD [Planctomycetota bacterium]|jgi:biopolymer transport protein ExbD|nr:biopolymer transporter ExbD [Planctomycetota bacterium]
MARLRRRHGHAPALADFAPLVDVTLMLVIFLLLTSEVVDSQAIPVQLPAAATGEEQDGGAFEVIITAAGDVVCGGSTVELEALTDLVQGHSVAVLQADALAPHGRVLGVVDTLRAAGVGAVYYATEEAETGVTDW